MQAADAAVGAVPVPDEAAAAAPAAPAEPAAQQEQAGQQAAVKSDTQTVETPAEAPASGEEAPPPPPPPPAAAEPAGAESAGEAEGVKAEEAQDEAAAVPPADEVTEEAAEAGEASEAPAKAEPPSDEALVARLRQLLAEIDLATTTEKQLRRKLEAEYGCDLADRKALLRAEINAYLQAEEGEGEGEEEAAEEGEEEEEQATSGRKRGRGGGSGSSLGSFLSPEMQEFLGEERLPRTQVVKRLWAYIKENGLQDPKDKRVIIFDEKLQKLFPGTRSNMFKLQKLLSKHCKTSDVVGGEDDDEEEGDEEAESEGEEPAPKKRRASSSAARSSGARRSSAAGGERKPGGFQKECQLSEEMAAWVGKPAASRPEITKFFWAYCKERGLQDPSDKSFILADDTLKALTGEERFKGFGFAKLIKQHLS